MAPPPPPVEPVRLTIALVGQTGNGKSATGNSLLGRDAFVAKRSLASVTERCEKHVALRVEEHRARLEVSVVWSASHPPRVMVEPPP